MAISAQPATNVLAKLYQLNMVEYHKEFKLINQIHGTVDITVSANHTMNNEAQTVFLKMYLLPASISGNGLLSSSRDIFLIFQPSRLHNPIAKNDQIKKKVGFKKPLLPLNS